MNRKRMQGEFTHGGRRRLPPRLSQNEAALPAAHPPDASRFSHSAWARARRLGEQYHAQWVLLTLVSGATACVVATSVFYHERIFWLALVFCCSFIAGVYLLNWLLETTHDFINSPSRLQVVKHKAMYWGLACSCYVLSLVVVVSRGRVNLALIFLFAMSVMYSTPSLPVVRKGTLVFLRLKDVTFLKSLLVALCFPLLSFESVRLFTSANMMEAPGILWFYAGFAITTFLATVYDDMLDIPGDTEAGVVTLPILLGAANTRRFLVGTTAMWVSVIAFFYGQGMIVHRHLLPLLLQAAFPLTWPAIHRAWPKSRLALDVSIEGVFWMTALALVLSGGG